MTMNLRFGFLLVFCLNCFVGFGQHFYGNTRNISMSDGLSHYKVFSFHQGSEGMWIGTEDGLDFYDGYSWKYWNQEQDQISNKQVNFILEDQQGLLWIFSTKEIGVKKDIRSIDILAKDQDKAVSFEQTFGDSAPFALSDIQDFFEDQQKQLYFFTGNKLWKYAKSSSFEEVILPVGFSPKTILSDDLLIGKMEDKLTLVSTAGKIIQRTDYLLKDADYQIKGSNQKFFVWQWGSTLEVFNRNTAGTYLAKRFPIQPDSKRIYPISLVDNESKQVCLNIEQDVFLYDFDGNLLYNFKGHPRLIYKDTNHNLWVGKSGITIHQLDQKRFTQYLYQNTKNLDLKKSFRCRGILEKDNRLYINTYRGLRIIDLDTDKILPNSLSDTRNFAILKDHKKQVWMGFNQLMQVESSSLEVKRRYPFELDKEIWSLFEDRDRRIWIGHMGLSYMENDKIERFEKYGKYDELSNALILFFFKDKNGVIWLGSNEGLYQLDPEKGIIGGFGKYRKGNNFLPANKFQHMFQDEQGHYWLATEDAGLLKWNKATGDIEQFDKSDGMPTNNIYSVYEDDFGYLWLSSFNGIIRFHKASQQITVFNKEEGITENEFNRISHYQSEDGQLFFGGQNGVTSFHPKDFKSIKTIGTDFEMSIEHISVVGHSTFRDTMPNGRKIDLAHLGPGARVLDLELSVSDIFWTDRASLYYTLEGLNQSNRIYITSRENVSADNHIELFGLKPGQYNLHIKAVQNNGKQLGKSMVVPIAIVTPFFHRPLFQFLATLGFIICVWVYMKIRTKRLKRRQRELEQMVEKRANEILKNQQTIKTQAQEILIMKDQLNKKDQLWLAQFRAIINERLSDPDLYLPDVINNMDISRSVFYEKVKALTQMTPNQYIQELRLSKAKTILDEGEVKTVKEVAQAIGIKRPSYFSKLYKERFGILPSAYFRELKNH